MKAWQPSRLHLLVFKQPAFNAAVVAESSNPPTSCGVRSVASSESVPPTMAAPLRLEWWRSNPTQLVVDATLEDVALETRQHALEIYAVSTA